MMLLIISPQTKKLPLEIVCRLSYACNLCLDKQLEIAKQMSLFSHPRYCR